MKMTKKESAICRKHGEQMKKQFCSIREIIKIVNKNKHNIKLNELLGYVYIKKNDFNKSLIIDIPLQNAQALYDELVTKYDKK